MTKTEILEKLKLKDPFLGLSPKPGALLWGWNGIRPIFGELIREQKPTLIIEVGAWLGLSTVTLSRELDGAHLDDTAIITIDTWLGSKEHWIEDKLRSYLELDAGHPTLYPRFMNNILSADCTKRVLPLPMTSLMGARYLREFEFQAELMYIDGSHDEKDVYEDLVAYWPLLTPGGIIFGDDWVWDSVRAAVHRFAHDHNALIRIDDINWMLKKPV